MTAAVTSVSMLPDLSQAARCSKQGADDLAWPGIEIEAHAGWIRVIR